LAAPKLRKQPEIVSIVQFQAVSAILVQPQSTGLETGLFFGIRACPTTDFY